MKYKIITACLSKENCEKAKEIAKRLAYEVSETYSKNSWLGGKFDFDSYFTDYERVREFVNKVSLYVDRIGMEELENNL